MTEKTTKRRYGWTCRLEVVKRRGKTYAYWKGYRRIQGRVYSIHIGRDWNRWTLELFKQKIAELEERLA